MRHAARVGLAPAEQLPEGVDLGEGEVVARDETQAGPGVEAREDRAPQQREPALGDERRDDGDLRGACEEGPELLREES
jgi:hypothetical protein